MSLLKKKSTLMVLVLASFTISSFTTKTNKTSSDDKVNFGNLVVETSWISKNKKQRKTFKANNVDDRVWMDKHSDGAVMMKCLAADGHRTELKEAVGDEANLNKYRKMSFTAQFTNIPENGVTIAQIHNRGKGVKRPWIRVYIDKDKRVKIKATLTNQLESKSTYEKFEGPKYKPGQEIKVTVRTGIKGQARAKFMVTTDGEFWEQELEPSSSWDVNKDTFYLKAGVYTEGEDKECTVKYSAFKIQH